MYLSSIVLAALLVIFGLCTALTKRRWQNLFLTLTSLVLSVLIVDIFFVIRERVTVGSSRARQAEIDRFQQRSSSAYGGLGEVEDANQDVNAASRRTGKYIYRAGTLFAFPHPVLGYAPTPSSMHYESKVFGDVFAYRDAIYVFDDKRRRMFPLRVGTEAEGHALFFGCSYTFGEGLNNPEMLSARFQEYSKKRLLTYNYAFKGYGTSQMYCQLQDDTLFDDVKPRNGIAIYGFIDDHIYRTTGKPDFLEIREDYPLFALHEDGSIDGPFKYKEKPDYVTHMDDYQRAKALSPLLRQLTGSSANRFVEPEVAVRTTAAVIAASRTLYEERFDGKFYCLIWPRRRLSPPLEKLLLAELASYSVNVITIPQSPYKHGEEQLHRLDAHPSAREIDWIARELCRWFEVKNEKPSKD